MPNKLESVVLWKGRTVPGERVIPEHLKLAILARGRVALPTSNVLWLLDVVRANGESWPDRLRRSLPEIFDKVRVTLDLFQNQRPGMTDQDIQDALQAFLIRYRLQHYPGCILIWQALPHTRYKDMERKLDLDMSLLFQRPRVRVQLRDPRRYFLLLYVCVPQEVERYIAPEHPAPPTAPSQRMPPLEALTSPSTAFNLRMGPGEASQSLGEQDGDVVPVKVLDKAKADEQMWYNIELLRDLRVTKGGKASKLSAGASCWIVGSRKVEAGLAERLLLDKGPSLEGGGLEYVAAPWNFFRYQLEQFERRHLHLDLNGRITMLRQMSHKKDLPFDYVIGSKPGKSYLDSIPYVQGEWQLLKDYQAVRVPDGRIVDLQHLLVGLDVLRRPETAVSYLRMYIGTNWAAATWAGDLGAGAVDLELKASKQWEKRHQNASASIRADYYFKSRAGDWDLVADVDAWGIHALRSPQLKTVGDLLASYYEHTIVEGPRTVTSARRGAVERFLAHYGFHYDSQVDYTSYPVLIKQKEATRRVREAIWSFARIWKFGKQPLAGEARPDPAAVGAMTAQFLYWLEIQAIENGASVP